MQIAQHCKERHTIKLNGAILLKKLIVSHYVRKFPTYDLIRKFVALFTKARHGLLCSGRTYSTVSRPYFNTHFNIILPHTSRSDKGFAAFSVPSICHHAHMLATFVLLLTARFVGHLLSQLHTKVDLQLAQLS